MTKESAYNNKWRRAHPEHAAAISKDYCERNPDKIKARNAARIRVTRYGLKAAEWEQLKTKGCGICGRLEKLCVDHCHKTGKVRGALCYQHNTGLGQFGDDANQLRKAICYLGEW